MLRNALDTTEIAIQTLSMEISQIEMSNLNPEEYFRTKRRKDPGNSQTPRHLLRKHPERQAGRHHKNQPHLLQDRQSEDRSDLKPAHHHQFHHQQMRAG
jgi:hypothetical protein